MSKIPRDHGKHNINFTESQLRILHVLQKIDDSYLVDFLHYALKTVTASVELLDRIISFLVRISRLDSSPSKAFLSYCFSQVAMDIDPMNSYHCD